jgi:hypothetical protein
MRAATPPLPPTQADAVSPRATPSARGPPRRRRTAKGPKHPAKARSAAPSPARAVPVRVACAPHLAKPGPRMGGGRTRQSGSPALSVAVAVALKARRSSRAQRNKPSIAIPRAFFRPRQASTAHTEQHASRRFARYAIGAHARTHASTHARTHARTAQAAEVYAWRAARSAWTP